MRIDAFAAIRAKNFVLSMRNIQQAMNALNASIPETCRKMYRNRGLDEENCFFKLQFHPTSPSILEPKQGLFVEFWICPHAITQPQ